MRRLEHSYEFIVVGGGLAGICAALTAAREGLSVALIQDRPVLGGASSKEIRVPPVGAVNGGFIYCRETGIIEEIFLENLFRNPTGSHEGWDLTLLSFTKAQPNLECFLNTHVDRVEISPDGTKILEVEGITVGSETRHLFRAPLFADCTGDGTVGALAGAPFRTGIEARSEFGESMAEVNPLSYGMGCSIQFRARDIGRPVDFRAPEWVDLVLNHDDFGPHRDVNASFMNDLGGFWWLEWIGDNDPVHDTEQVKESLQKIVYATWDYLKNRSPIRERLRNMELDWVGSIPGKRESRRLEGDHILTQGDIEEARSFPDAVAYGGWGFDHHPKEGFFSKEPSHHVYHASLYNVPLRSLYSRKISNLFLAGRNISATHYALTSTRVMLTCSQLGEAVGAAAAECARRAIAPRDAAHGDAILEVQTLLGRRDHFIFDLPLRDADDLARTARIRASSVLPGSGFEPPPGDEKTLPMDRPRLFQFPVSGDYLASLAVLADADDPTTVTARLYEGPASGATFPQRMLDACERSVARGRTQWITFPFERKVDAPGWHFLELAANPHLHIHFGDHPPVGYAGYLPRPLDPIRIDAHNRWTLFERNSQVRHGYAMRISPAQELYSPSNLVNGLSRPTRLPNLWISEPTNFYRPEWVEIHLDGPRLVSELHLLFDSSLDFTFYQAWRGYEHRTMPSLVRRYRVLAARPDGEWEELVAVAENYQRRRVHRFEPRTTGALRIEVLETNGIPRAQIYGIHLYR